MKQALIVFALLFFVFGAYGQNTKGLSVPKTPDNNAINGKTYALIMGVSKYKNPAIPQLQYADKDAMAFRNYLVATGVDSNNITLLINEQATDGAFWASIGFLNDVAKKGDRVFIYFSGHGDVENKTIVKDAFLLPYDAPKCMYPAGAIAVILLKSWIATLSANGIQPIFIADACHSGNLAGGREGMDAAAAMLKDNWQDEIKILSCQPGELSLEGKQWGGGRGLFSYELINGMAGQADKNGDGKVTVRELNLFMMEKVPDEANPAPQNPALFGNPETVIATVNAGLLNAITEPDNKMLARVDVKGFDETLLAGLNDSIKYNYKMFKAALDTGNYLDGDRKLYSETRKIVLAPSAYYYYSRIPDNDKTHLLVSLMKRDMCSVIMEDADNTLDRLFNHIGSANLSQFSRLQYAMGILRNILGDKKLNDYGFLPKMYAFEAMANLWWTHAFLSQKSITVLDSAISIAPKAGYLYFIRADFYHKLDDENNAVKDLKKTIQLSPKLVYAYSELNKIYTAKKMYDSVVYIYSKLFVADSNSIYQHWDNMAIAFAYLNKKDSAYKYIDIGISIKDPKAFSSYLADSSMIPYSVGCYNIACAYSVLNEKANSISYIEKSIVNGYSDYDGMWGDADLVNIRSTPEFEAMMVKYFPKEFDSTTAIYFIKKAKRYRDEEKNYTEAERCFKKALSIDPNELVAYLGLSKVYIYAGDKKKALSTLKEGLEKGWKNFESIAKDSGFDSIRTDPEYAAIIAKYFPVQYESTNSEYYIQKGKYYRDTAKNYIEAEKDFNKAISIDPDDARPCIGLSKTYALTGDVINSMDFLEDALKKGWTDTGCIDNDPLFNNIRSLPEFKALMKKYFPDMYKE